MATVEASTYNVDFVCSFLIVIDRAKRRAPNSTRPFGPFDMLTDVCLLLMWTRGRDWLPL